MADQTVNSNYPNTSATTEAPITSDRAPAFSQQTHPTTGPNDPAPEVRHAEDHDDEITSRTAEAR